MIPIIDQEFYMCHHGHRMGQFSCPGGTLFSSQHETCDWKGKVMTMMVVMMVVVMVVVTMVIVVVVMVVIVVVMVVMMVVVMVVMVVMMI